MGIPLRVCVYFCLISALLSGTGRADGKDPSKSLCSSMGEGVYFFGRDVSFRNYISSSSLLIVNHHHQI